MKLIIKLFPEIIIKSRSLRKNMTVRLCNNIRNSCRDIDVKIKVRNLWDRLEVNADESTDLQESSIIERLSSIRGIDKIEYISRVNFSEKVFLMSTVAANSRSAFSAVLASESAFFP